jgi:hypothetical protein
MVKGVRERDHGRKYLDDLTRLLAKQKHYAMAGVLGKTAKRGDGGLTNVELMLMHEFGTSTMPERSVIRKVFSARRAEYEKMLKRGTKLLVQGKFRQPIQVMRPIAMKMASDMQDFIRQNRVTPPTGPAATQRKRAKGKGPGDPVTLVYSGKLVRAITWDAK